MNTINLYSKAGLIFLAIFALAAMMFFSSCATRPLGACYENGYVGYGHTPKAIHGPKRQSY